ncbi:MAG TPA: zinc-binding dehydrogenase [Streptomyces sp.]|uniref:quinone oxidoreductase family protein n=1 Tax=Streptomyces sp. TaxID=1931 RepID=UPI002D427E5C|nr:zinc-binding dehydrogenase [Streptomyces sp.]HZG06048.1 zinc-binding dehydrogenase [Streptomyces sp.]
MRTIRFHEFGGPEVLRLEDTPVPRPGPGQVLIAAEAVSVGFAQTQMRRDIFPAPMWHPRFPVVLGGDVVGVVAGLGPGVSGFREGDRVGAFTLHGAYAEYVVVDEEAVLPVPDGMDAAEATALPSPGPIAMGTLSTASLRPGESVLVHAASGGIGHLAVQLARAAGAGQVIATAGSARKLEFARELGADVLIDYSEDDWADRVRDATGGKGVDVILDSVGGEVLRRGVGLLAPFGRLVFYGSAGGGLAIPSVSPMELIDMRFITGFALSRWRAARRKQYLDNHDALVRYLSDGTVRHAIHATLPLEEVATAHELVESRAHTGRIVLLTGRTG